MHATVMGITDGKLVFSMTRRAWATSSLCGIHLHYGSLASMIRTLPERKIEPGLFQNRFTCCGIFRVSRLVDSLASYLGVSPGKMKRIPASSNQSRSRVSPSNVVPGSC